MFLRRLCLIALAGVVLLVGPMARTSLNRPASLFSSTFSNPADPAIARLRADQPRAAILRPIAADIDRDGDMDVVSSSVEAGVEVWINDGTGHFERQTTNQSRSLTGDDTVLRTLPDGTTTAASPTPKWLGALPGDRVPGTVETRARFRSRPASGPASRYVTEYHASRAPPSLLITI